MNKIELKQIDYKELQALSIKQALDIFVLQDRISKAIKYIKSDEFWYSHVNNEMKLLDILEGKENE